MLCTGAAGFLGKAVCEKLRGEGHITIATDLVEGGDLTKPFFTADITQGVSIDPIPVDAVVHMAAIAAPRTCEADPGLAYNVNVNGTHQVIKFALTSGAKKFVFISSAHVYGISPKYMPTDEQHPLHPQETYTTTKILGEKLCELYHENYGLSYTTLRLFNAYGPGQLPGYFIPDMIAKAKDGGISLNGGGTTKDFVYVDDVAKAVLAAIETPYVGPINIGTQVESSLAEVVLMIANGMDTECVTYNDPVGVGTRMQADRSRAKRVLKWEPTVNLVDGLRRTVDAS